MSNEVIIQDTGSLLPVTKQDVSDLKQQRELLKDFVRSQLIKGIDNDYAMIPGTKKDSLLKPGAEKLLRLFGLGVRMRQVDKEIDRYANFAMFTYRAEVFHLRSGNLIAECDGTTNSQEVKYRGRKVLREVGKSKTGAPIKEQREEETPICDILNTLMKMAQKRAMIGATILAVGASDFFTCDIEDEKDAEQIGIKPKVEVSEQVEDSPPSCCGRPMLISKFPDRDGEIPWYCATCKKKQKR